MKQPWNTSLRLTCGVIALMGASLTWAQTPQAMPEAAAPVAAPTTQKAPHHPAKKHHHAKPKPKHHHSAHKYASPQQHEAAAVAGERRQGVGPANPKHGDQLDEYQRNALKRCDVFKAEDDRRACVERVRQPQISGSVEGGGLIREYTQTIQLPAHPHAHPHHPAPGKPPRTDHLVHPPVEPVR